MTPGRWMLSASGFCYVTAAGIEFVPSTTDGILIGALLICGSVCLGAAIVLYSRDTD